MNLSVNQISFMNLSYQVDQQMLLNHVSGKFQAGQVHAILGQNGAGKSTLLRCLTKEWLPTEGAVQFSDRDLQSYSYAELALQRAVLSQHNELAFSFTVEQLVSLGFETQQTPWAERQMLEVLQVTDVSHLRDRDVLTLSGGEQKRVQLSRVLAQIWPSNYQNDFLSECFAGKWLFLDEWSEGLDLKHQIQIGRLLRQWAKQGLGIVMISHDLNQVMQFTDTCLMMKAGKVFTQGSSLEVMTEDNLSELLDISIKVLKLGGSDFPTVVAV